MKRKKERGKSSGREERERREIEEFSPVSCT